MTTKKDKVTDYHDFTTIDTLPEERERLNVGDIWINAARCRLCGDEPRSRNQHDFRYCKCGAIAVDGGSWYARRVGDLDAVEEMLVPFNHISQIEIDI